MQVEFERFHANEEDPHPGRVLINPEFVSMVLPSSEFGERATILRGPDGRGIVVAGSYEETKRKLIATAHTVQ